MGTRIALVHATVNAIEPMAAVVRRCAAQAAVLNFLDEGLIQAVHAQGGVTPAALRRLVRLIETAVGSQADGVLLTCSAFSPFNSVLAALCEVPLVSADRAMLAAAVELGRRISVIATVGAAAPAAEQQLHELALGTGRDVTVQTTVVPEAFVRLEAGDTEAHDRTVQEAARRQADWADVVVLAQISMARAASGLADLPVPVLTSPERGVRAILAAIALQGRHP